MVSAVSNQRERISVSFYEFAFKGFIVERMHRDLPEDATSGEFEPLP